MARPVSFRTLLGAGLLAVVLGAAVARADTARVCFKNVIWSDGGYIYYVIDATDTGTVLDRWNMIVNPPTLMDHNEYAALHRPTTPGTMWGEGVAFAAAMASRNAWYANSPTAEAYWDRDTNTGVDTWRFYPENIAFVSTNCGDVPTGGGTSPTTTQPPAGTPPAGTPPATGDVNCMYAGGSGSGVTCSASDICCGYGTMSPSCIPPSSTDKCCQWYLAATTCAASQSCCGGGGPGASSSAFCCDAGSTCCNAQYTSGVSNCCPAGSTCCAGSTVGLCCAAGEECVPNENRCRAPTGPTGAPPSNAPGVPPSSGAVHVCLQHASTFYDITVDASATTMKRYNTATSPSSLIDTQGYASLSRPGSPSDMWGDGVAFAATMQTRSAWLNSEPNPSAYWDAPNGGSETWRFQTSVGGVATEWAFRTSQCNPPPFPVHVCLQHGSTYYDITVDASATTMKRYNTATSPATLIDTQGYASLSRPGSPSDMWGDGVAFAATMQTRSAWLNSEPNPSAYWDALSGGSETWRFQTSIGGVATEWAFRSSQCQNI